jgi:CDP-diacylglycerol--inositol 3-phosphatidyltransferase
MVTDRVSTCGFLFMLSHIYPEWKFTFVLLISIDIFSHWFHVSSVSGHHKSEETLQKRNFILRAYYAVPFLFAYCCIGAELFYVLLYTLHFYQHPMVSMVEPLALLSSSHLIVGLLVWLPPWLCDQANCQRGTTRLCM